MQLWLPLPIWYLLPPEHFPQRFPLWQGSLWYTTELKKLILFGVRLGDFMPSMRGSHPGFSPVWSYSETGLEYSQESDFVLGGSLWDLLLYIPWYVPLWNVSCILFCWLRFCWHRGTTPYFLYLRFVSLMPSEIFHSFLLGYFSGCTSCKVPSLVFHHDYVILQTRLSFLPKVVSFHHLN